MMIIHRSLSLSLSLYIYIYIYIYTHYHSGETYRTAVKRAKGRCCRSMQHIFEASAAWATTIASPPRSPSAPAQAVSFVRMYARTYQLCSRACARVRQTYGPVELVQPSHTETAA